MCACSDSLACLQVSTNLIMMSVPYICDLSLIVLLSGSLEIPQHRLAVTGKYFKINCINFVSKLHIFAQIKIVWILIINFIHDCLTIHFTTHLKNCLESDISAQLFSLRLAIHRAAFKLIIDCNSRIVYFEHNLYKY